MEKPEVSSNSGVPSEGRSSPVAQSELTLKNGDSLTRSEFERRYAARPDLKKAELIEGVVRLASPVRVGEHGEPHAIVVWALTHYFVFTPAVQVANNATVRLDLGNVLQPDALLRIDEAAGGRSRVSEDGYVEGGPELVAEVAASSASFDMRGKLRAWRRNGVQEYIVWRTEEKLIDWFELAGGEYRPLPRDERGVIESRVFPGLRLATQALIAGDASAVLAELDKGIESPRHRRFISRLAAET